VKPVVATAVTTISTSPPIHYYREPLDLFAALFAWRSHPSASTNFTTARLEASSLAASSLGLGEAASPIPGTAGLRIVTHQPPGH
jgi:hypothetical protein